MKTIICLSYALIYALPFECVIPVLRTSFSMLFAAYMERASPLLKVKQRGTTWFHVGAFHQQSDHSRIKVA
jgi:hypothetical protein